MNDIVTIGRSYDAEVLIEYGRGTAITIEVPQEIFYRDEKRNWFRHAPIVGKRFNVCFI